MKFHADVNHKRIGVAILISDKMDFKSKVVTKNKVHYIMSKGSTEWENMTILNTYMHSIPEHLHI